MDHMRVLLAARKSRKAAKGDAEAQQENQRYERQDNRAKAWAEAQGHSIIHTTADTKTGTVQPWNRKDLGPWMTEPAKLAMYDAILISDLDRLSRAGQVDFVDIEAWANRTGKTILVRGGLRYPARTDSERGDWDAKKRSARNEWEATRDRHADTREIIKANGGAIGRPPYGYTTTGPDYHKQFTPDEHTAPLAVEAFQRVSDGKSAKSVAEWLSELTGAPWRVKRVLDMIRRVSYRADDNNMCERDGHTYPAIITRELWDSANAALAANYVPHIGGREVVHAYSSKIYCQCGAVTRHHKSDRGQAKYFCARGRSGLAGEAMCEYPPIPFDAANEAVDAVMSECRYPEMILVTTGGSAAKQTELKAIREKQSAAVAAGDMPRLAELVVSYNEAAARQTDAIRTELRPTGKTIADLWRDGSVDDRRSILSSPLVKVTITPTRALLDYRAAEDAQGFKWVPLTPVA